MAAWRSAERRPTAASCRTRRCFPPALQKLDFRRNLVRACNRTQVGAEHDVRCQRDEHVSSTMAAFEPGLSDRHPIVSVKAGDAPGQDWDRMMAAAQVGDANAYRTLLAELAVWLRRYYARRLPPAMTEDAVQDVLLAIHEKRHTYDPERPFGPWLAAIARYKWIDRLRSLKAEAFEPLDENIGVPDHGDSVIAGSTFHQLLAELKPPQAEAIRLVKLEGYSVEEASRATGQSVSLIKVNIHRGIKRLTNIIKGAGDAD
ncbi:MAG TPA: sigma-70 family RNA polymerase sigma factor [Rhodopila sp.]|jgi:RNA polymerase sigma-70 factor (ECF subfamily)